MSDMMSHLSGGENRGSAFLAVVLLFTILALIFVLLRLYVRVVLKPAFGGDDVMIILATLLAIVSSGFNVPEVLAGYGRHMSNLPVDDIHQIFKWYYLATLLLVFSLAASKISICLFLLRVLRQTRIKLKRAFPFGIIVLLTLITIPTAGYALGQCQPVRKLWNPTVSGHCLDKKIYVYIGHANGGPVTALCILFQKLTNAATNAFCDFALAIYPIYFIKDIQLPLHRKIVLGLLMCCGVVCGTIAVARTVVIGKLTIKSDLTYESVIGRSFAAVEENVSIIVACVPTLGPIFRAMDDKFKSLRSTNSTRKRGYLKTKPKGKLIPLHSMEAPSPGKFQYESSVVATTVVPQKAGQDGYESETNLISGIERMMTFEVQSSNARI